jgi:hypothetical protein
MALQGRELGVPDQSAIDPYASLVHPFRRERARRHAELRDDTGHAVTRDARGISVGFSWHLAIAACFRALINASCMMSRRSSAILESRRRGVPDFFGSIEALSSRNISASNCATVRVKSRFVAVQRSSPTLSRASLSSRSAWSNAASICSRIGLGGPRRPANPRKSSIRP